MVGEKALLRRVRVRKSGSQSPAASYQQGDLGQVTYPRGLLNVLSTQEHVLRGSNPMPQMTLVKLACISIDASMTHIQQ
jgi:hypothetical protein